MTEPLPFKEPPTLMEQTLDLAPAPPTFEENVTRFKEGRTQMRKAVLDEWHATKQDPKRKMTNFAEAVGVPVKTLYSYLEEAKVFADQKNTVATVVFDDQLSQALPTQTAAREFARLPEEEKQDLTAQIEQELDAESRMARAKVLLAEAAKRRKDANEADIPEEERKAREAARRAQGVESLIKQSFRQISQSLSCVLHQMDEPEARDEVRGKLQHLADQLAKAGIYPTVKR